MGLADLMSFFFTAFGITKAENYISLSAYMISKLKTSSIAVLKIVLNGVLNVKELKKKVGLAKTHFYDTINDLIEQDYIVKIDSRISVNKSSKTILFRDVAVDYDVDKLLHDSNEQVFSNLTDAVTIEDLQRSTNLSLATIKRSLSELQAIGAIKREKDKITLNRERDHLYLFAQFLKTEKERRDIEPYADIIYQNYSIVVKRVPKGKVADGELTGFSLFSDYGIEYHTSHDYYVKQPSGLNLQDVLLHAIIAAVTDKDKNEMTIAILFYLKNREKLDPINLRIAARKYGISGIWLDMESYVRENELKNSQLFPSRNEFIDKANLYDIPSELYTLTNAYPKIFDDIGSVLPTKTYAYLIGGENMLKKGLKAATKDCDIVVRDKKSFNAIIVTLKKFGYISVNQSELTSDDKRLFAADILKHPTKRRIDIFIGTFGKKLAHLSDRMVKRAEIEMFGNLYLGILHNDDIFLLKSVAAREGDIDDMFKIVQSGDFDWRVVWDELTKQEHTTRMNLSVIFHESIEDLKEKYGIVPPFQNKLTRKVLDKHIDELLRNGKSSLKEIIASLEGGDLSEDMIRHRIDYLEKLRHLRKVRRGSEVFLELRHTRN